ncbi:NAD-dependent epimerase [Enterococcus hulanensis]|uniref:NAD-dependent epimerase n=1 Tax=Enterococcus hulanensis TaxID=2559929 RepID=A0ABU3EY94_9ENTE|nr:NAD-dependent epimerase [Enterococcus hulanensis]MDT2599298.1 NAD-dependent epimerase [Enterococcus hulanensis]MDT2608705.1 NAD-dependent epimerase [Enterococcus hulanensis]MDT2616460.1 NAD-dependent epimerase [Enterococcus hulanensis]MDT2627500.1 NAD-dependent epimerase [Enterococcus hulanensis]MDT2655530.1 NAD-dependent epimerase [Enterococcus hulanensis]
MKILVTGAAGFIGSRLIELLDDKNEIVGIDNLNDYYDTSLKIARLNKLNPKNNFRFLKMNLADKDSMLNLFSKENFDIVIHLGAQAGVRYSIENPYAYIDSNIMGMMNILEGARNNPVQHLIYASSSSVYGGNEKVPFSTEDSVDHPVSLYAATKKSNELMAHTYSNLFDIPTTGLRFFTVYGPFGRPDMAYFSFTNKIVKGETIEVFNNGDMMRDFTYIDDVVEAIIRLIPEIPQRNPNWTEKDVSESWAPYRLFNIGNSTPVKLLDFIETIEKHLGIKAKKVFKPMQPGDVQKTFADVADLERVINFKPTTTIDSGIKKFVNWYKDYYQI